ncbi:MAG: hypothetical protein IIT68_07225 [Treponema sp.]|nr:hypothetical protein [Treponema sp.]
MSETTEKTEPVAEQERNNQLKTAGITFGIMVVTLALLLCFTLLAHNSWNRGLRSVVSKTLSEQTGTVYTVSQALDLNSTLETECAVFTIAPRGFTDDGSRYAVIVRVTTLYGPLAAVYTYTAGAASAEFLTYAELHSKAKPQIIQTTQDTVLDYWAQKIPGIVNAAKVSSPEVRK